MSASEQKIDSKQIGYIVACVNEFARASDLNEQEAFRYLYSNGGLAFLLEYYETEHTLSFEETINDLKRITRQAGGQIA
jgi:hypothetical protein